MNVSLITTILNRLVALDPEGIAALIDARVPVNRRVAEVPGVMASSNDPGEGASLGFVGLMQAVYSTEGSWLKAVFDDEHNLLRFTEEPWPREKYGEPFLDPYS